MNRRLFWKLCLIIVTGTVAFFYAIYMLTSRTEEGMSYLAENDQEQLIAWGREAEALYFAGDQEALIAWLDTLMERENTWAAVVESKLHSIANHPDDQRYYKSFRLGRSVRWKIHLYFKTNPVMEVTFKNRSTHFLIRLPQRMRPGVYWGQARIILQIVVPMLLLAIVAIILYRHIMGPLRQLQLATRSFSQGQFDVQVSQRLGNRKDELAELANTFDQMASRIGEMIISQRQLIADMSHELRTPLARLDVAVEMLRCDPANESCIDRVEHESQQIRKLMEDTLTLAWLDNERPSLNQEDLDLVDLLDVVIRDARFEFPDREIAANFPEYAPLEKSNNRSLGQALENIIRNAMRFTPPGRCVNVSIQQHSREYQINVADEGPGVAEDLLDKIFRPFFREDRARSSSHNSFGLGLALAKRQIEAVGGQVLARNRDVGGLQVEIYLPIQQASSE